MTLEYTTVPVVFEGALDQKKNYKAVLPGAFLTLQNCVRRKEALWEKRYGVTALPKTVLAANSVVPALTAGVRFATLDDTLCMLDGRNVWNYAAVGRANVLNSYGAAPAIGWDHHALIRSSRTALNADVAYCNGFMAVTWLDELLGLAWAIYDATTGAVVLPPKAFQWPSNTGTNCKVASAGDYFIFAWEHGAGVLATTQVHAPLGGTPQVIATGVSISPMTFFPPNIDMETYDSGAVVFTCNSTTAQHIWVGFIKTDGTIGNGSNGYPAPIHHACTSAVTVPAANILSVSVYGSQIHVLTSAAVTDHSLYYTAFDAALSASSADTLVNSGSPLLIRNATIVPRANASPFNDGRSEYAVYYEVGTPSVANDGPKQAIYVDYFGHWNGTNGSTPSQDGSATLRMAGVGLASKAVQYSGDKSNYFYVAFETALQPTYYLVRDDGNLFLPGAITSCVIVAKFAAGAAAGLTKSAATGTYASGLLPRLAYDGSSKFHCALGVVTVTSDYQQGASASTIYGIDHYSVDLANGDYISTNLGRGLQTTCGTVNHYDGLVASELGFNNYPEGISATPSTTGGTLATGTYYFRVTYEWYDRFGQRHRSCPSTIQSVATTGPTASIALSIPPLAMTNRNFQWNPLTAFTPYKVAIYLAEQGQTSLFYHHGSVAPGNTYQYLTYTIARDPTTTNELLYTTGGIVENIAPPAARCSHVHKNRMWVGGLEASEIWFSKEFVRGEGVAFSDQFTIPIETKGGDVTALASLDDKLIIFKRDRLYFLVGDGPTDAGNEWDYPEPIKIPSDVGTVQPNTVVQIPSGLIFKSLKGWFLLNRGLQISYIGDRVEDYNGNTARSATVLSDQNEVRFVHSNGDCLVYNYYFNQWSTFTNYQGVDSVVANSGTFYRLGSDGTINQEIVGQYNDNGTTYSMTIETAWFQFRKIQGFQRIYDITFIGDFYTHHTAQVSIAYDFNSAYNQTISYNTQTNGITGPVLQLRVQPQIQKCSAMKIKLVDIDNIVAGGGASFKATALTFDIAGKKGVLRLPTGQQIG